MEQESSKIIPWCNMLTCMGLLNCRKFNHEAYSAILRKYYEACMEAGING